MLILCSGGYGKLVRDPSFNFRKHCAQAADRAKLEKGSFRNRKA
ncbi:hypothetical protein BofuT4_P031780.1 [Botrytis cinerea T4]|uniref:Uncharacterized protein n=1 Tax=Botryotinia fuckeliana (strain T4) TaxID=999810 RepID=G2Y9M6_BOTF4|nr:hypothetical protein BofuT4_P031780.1 [Botrytis cinerea T4]